MMIRLTTVLIAVLLFMLVGGATYAFYPENGVSPPSAPSQSVEHPQGYPLIEQGDPFIVPYLPVIEIVALETGMSVELIAAVVWAECTRLGDGCYPSVQNPYSLSTGLMQVVPHEFAGGDPTHWAYDRPSARWLSDPYSNLYYGASYLQKMLSLSGGDTAIALAAYNSGYGAIRCHCIPDNGETPVYVRAVMERLSTYLQ